MPLIDPYSPLKLLAGVSIPCLGPQIFRVLLSPVAFGSYYDSQIFLACENRTKNILWLMLWIP